VKLIALLVQYELRGFHGRGTIQIDQDVVTALIVYSFYWSFVLSDCLDLKSSEL